LQNLFCSECKCSPQDCAKVILRCKICIKQICCCSSIHDKKISILTLLFKNIKKVFVAALGIEILCIMSAEVGQNTGLYIFGFNLLGIVLSYMIGFTLAGFSTFMSIVGRYDFSSRSNSKIEGGCCSFLEEISSKGFIFNLIETFLNFKRGLIKLIINKNNPQMKNIIKSSIAILITAESACIITAETVDLLFYKSSLFLAIPLSLIIGTLTLTIFESLKKIKNVNAFENNCQCIRPDSTMSTTSSFIPSSIFKKEIKENNQSD
jgi:hypothetical protein